MAHDVPADVQDVLTQLHEAAVEAAATATGDDGDAGDDVEPPTADDDIDDTTIVDDTGDVAADDDIDDTTIIDDTGDVAADDDIDDTTIVDDDVDGTTADDAPEAFAAPLETARTVASNKLPAGELRSQFTHGYDRALAVAAAEPAVAAEYVRAVDRRLAASTDRDREGVAGDDPEHSSDPEGSDDPDEYL